MVPTLTADSASQQAELDLVCQQVTSLIDGYLHQPLRAVVVTEQNSGPLLPRVSIDPHTRIAGLVTRQWPVTAVNAVQVSMARAFPPQWTLVPQSGLRIRTPVLMPASGVPVYGPSGGNVVDMQPGFIDGFHGRGGWLVSNSYTSGYPHTQLTASAAAQATTLAVDDVTLWPGWTGIILDGTSTEWVTATAATATTPVQLPGIAGTAETGPGTVTLASPLQYAHSPGALLTAIPLAALQAAALKCAVVALETLAAIAVQSSGGQLPGGLGALAFEAEAALDPFKRIM